MSELKAFDVGLGQYSEDGSPCVVAFDADKNPRLLNEKVYLKSEADKVIADKDKKIAELEVDYKEACYYLQTTDLIKDEQLAVIRRHKYKWCLAMADMCKARYDEEDARINGRGASWDYISNEMKYWERWSKRWLELAEKFKPNNEE